MRVVFIAENYPNNIQPFSGKFIHLQALALRDQGVEVRVLAPIPWVPTKGTFRGWPAYAQVYATDNVDGIPVVHPRYLTPPRAIRVDYWRMILPLQYAPMLENMRRTFPFDLIHGQNLFPEGHISMRLAQRFGVPSVVSSRGSDAVYWPYNLRRYRIAAETVISSADQIVAVSHAQRRTVEQLAQPRTPCEVVYNGVDPEVYKPHPIIRARLREQLGLKSGDLLISFVGELSVNKGVGELITAFGALAARYEHIHLVMIGGSSSSDQWQPPINDSTTHTRLRYTGMIPSVDVVRWLNASDIFAFPSHREGLPNAVLEAASVGLPIVATMCGGIPEIIEEGVNGILIPTKDTAALIDALDCMIRNPELRAKFSTRLRADILRKFSWNVHGKKLRDIYEKVLRCERRNPVRL